MRALRALIETFPRLAVMGENRIGMVQSIVCDEFTAHSFDEDNATALQIRQTVEGKIRDYLASVGITLDFFGWADTFTFDQAVQKSINDLYEAKTLLPVLTTIQAEADIKVKEGLAAGLAAHGLPANMITLPTNLLEGLPALLGSKGKQ